MSGLTAVRERPMVSRCFEVETRTQYAHHLLLAIASHWSKDDPLCRSGMKRLRKACRLPRTTYYRALAELVEIGAIEVERRVDSFGYTLPSFYRMTPENAPTLRVEPADRDDDRQLSLPPVEVEPVAPHGVSHRDTVTKGVPTRDSQSLPGTVSPYQGTHRERTENQRAQLASLATRASRAEPSLSESARPAVRRLATDPQRALLEILADRLEAPLSPWASWPDLSAAEADAIIRAAKPHRKTAEAGRHRHEPVDWALVRTASGAPHSGLLRCGCGAFVQGFADDAGVSIDLLPGVAWRLGPPDRVRLTEAGEDPLRFDVLPAGLLDVDPMIACVDDAAWCVDSDGNDHDDDDFAVALAWGALPKRKATGGPTPETPGGGGEVDVEPTRRADAPVNYWKQFDKAKNADDITAAAAVATLAERSGDTCSAACMRETVKAMRQMAIAGGA